MIIFNIIKKKIKKNKYISIYQGIINDILNEYDAE